MAKGRAKRVVKQSSGNVDVDCTNLEKPEIKGQTNTFKDLKGNFQFYLL